mmetsp:Transcript_29862/g.72674  ORF Transcript_29862/g.72674 Transcript_29862/m.72674 type:complete len:272 (+) Transcript_29862:689-1504(+)
MQQDSSAKSENRLVYVEPSEDFLRCCQGLPVNEQRNALVHSLITAVPGLVGGHFKALPLRMAGKPDLLSFHSVSYVDFLRQGDTGDEDLLEEFGLVDDCPHFKGVYEYARWLAGGTIVACNSLCTGVADIAIWWGGGRHHARVDEAAGFCYVNDICIGIQVLLKAFDRVLYVDIDAHHGDAVEEAYQTTDKVLTVSFHRCEPGFYPGTGILAAEASGIGVEVTLSMYRLRPALATRDTDMFTRRSWIALGRPSAAMLSLCNAARTRLQAIG